MTGSRLRRGAVACVAAFSLCACASGTSRVETLLHQIHPVDAVALGALGVLAARTVDADTGWSTQVTSGREAARYRIAISRWAGHGNGEGEFALRFDREARRIATQQSCAGYRVLAYSERHESRLLGSSRVAEGEIECL